MKETVPSGACLNFLIKTPVQHDKTFRAIEVLEAESRVMQWKCNIVCVPNLHAKFTIINDRDLFFGSPNATTGGLYHNKEVLVAFYAMPTIADHFRRIFEGISRQAYNQHWELVRDFHGASVERRLSEITVRYFRRIGNKEVRIPFLISEFQRYGFDFGTAKEGLQELLKYGILYNPREGFVKLVPKYEW